MENQMIIARCHYTMPDGHQCGSPALRDQDYCYFHHPASKPRKRKQRTRYPNFDLAAVASIDNPRAIQQTLAAVLYALAANTISLYQAQTMIYALQLASNLNR